MKSTKVSGPTGVTSDMLKKAGIITEMKRNIVNEGEKKKSEKGRENEQGRKGNDDGDDDFQTYTTE